MLRNGDRFRFFARGQSGECLFQGKPLISRSADELLKPEDIKDLQDFITDLTELRKLVISGQYRDLEKYGFHYHICIFDFKNRVNWTLLEDPREGILKNSEIVNAEDIEPGTYLILLGSFFKKGICKIAFRNRVNGFLEGPGRP